jgi:hypothetical protein
VTDPRPVLATVVTPDGAIRKVHTQAELDELTGLGAEPVGPQWRYRENRAERRKRKRQR